VTRVLVLLAAAATVLLILEILVRVYPPRYLQPSPGTEDHPFINLGRALACDERYPGLDARRGGHFRRWREESRVVLRPSWKPGPKQEIVARAMAEEKARLETLQPEVPGRPSPYTGEWQCESVMERYRQDSRSDLSRIAHRTAHYELCAETVPGFESAHAGDFKAWKKRNDGGMPWLISERSRRSPRHYAYWSMKHIREDELEYLATGAEAHAEYGRFCRETLVALLRTDTMKTQ
jgi:hypothetical protein